MCPWCFLTPACPCRRGGASPGLMLGTALVAFARRAGAVRLGFGALLLALAVIAISAASSTWLG
jgi:hypothetical protein